MTICSWQPILEFRSPDEFNRFVEYIGECVKAGLSREKVREKREKGSRKGVRVNIRLNPGFRTYLRHRSFVVVRAT